MSAVVVVGSINEDLVIRTAVTPSPGQTVLGESISRLPGGKGANQAVAAARMSAQVHMVGAVGADGAGRRQLHNLRANGVDVNGVSVESAPTGTAVVTVDRTGENSIIVIPGANHADRAPAADTLGSLLTDGDIMIAQLELPHPAIAAALLTARSSGATTVLNAAPYGVIADMLPLVDVLVVNQPEARALAADLGIKFDSDWAELAETLTRCQVPAAIITLGSEGAVIADRTAVTTVTAVDVIPLDTTGAGDTFVGALAAMLAAGHGLVDAARIAGTAAGIACTAAGAQQAMPTLTEVSDWQLTIQSDQSRS